MAPYPSTPPALIQVLSSSDSQKSRINTSTNNTFEIGGVVYITSTTPAPQGCAQYMTFDVATPPAHPSTNAVRVKVIKSTEDYNVAAVESHHPTTKRKNYLHTNIKSKLQKTRNESDETKLTHQSSAKTAGLPPYLTVPCDANEKRNDGINRTCMTYNEEHCEISPDTPKVSRLDNPRKLYVSECNNHTAVLSKQCDGSSTNYRLLSNVNIMKFRQGRNITQGLKIKASIQQVQCDFSVTVTAVSDGLFIAIQCVLNTIIAHDNEYITTAQIIKWIERNQRDLYVKKQPRTWCNQLNIAISCNQEILETFSTSSKPGKYRLKTAILTGEVETECSNSASSTDCLPSSKVTIENRRKDENNKQELKINVLTEQQQYDFSVTVTATSNSSFIAIQCVLNAMIAHDNEYSTIPQIRRWMKEKQGTLFSEKTSKNWDEHLRKAISANTEIIETSPLSSGLREYRLKQAILTGGVEA